MQFFHFLFSTLSLYFNKVYYIQTVLSRGFCKISIIFLRRTAYIFSVWLPALSALFVEKLRFFFPFPAFFAQNRHVAQKPV